MGAAERVSVMSIDELDSMVTWMRKRGVGTLVDGATQIHLATLDEPQPPKAEAQRQETEKERTERLLRDRYGALPRRREGSE